jgi:hypothetical protein
LPPSTSSQERHSFLHLTEPSLNQSLKPLQFVNANGLVFEQSRDEELARATVDFVEYPREGG